MNKNNLLQQVQADFDQAATGYAAVASVQHANYLALLDRLATCLLRHGDTRTGWAVDIGCGDGSGLSAGLASTKMQEAINCFQWFGLDVSLQMLKQISVPRLAPVQADAQRLPIASASMQCVISNFALHWLDQPDQGLREINRVLCPSAIACVSLPIATSLAPLTQIWNHAGQASPLHQFPSRAKLKQVLNGFVSSTLEVSERSIVLPFESSDCVITWLRQTGARNITRTQGRMRPSQYRQIYQALDDWLANGSRLTFEMLDLCWLKSSNCSL